MRFSTHRLRRISHSQTDQLPAAGEELSVTARDDITGNVVKVTEGVTDARSKVQARSKKFLDLAEKLDALVLQCKV